MTGDFLNAPISYKGYCSSPEWDTNNKKYYGIIENIDDIVCFCAEKETSVQIEFENSVDEYISICKNLNRQPLAPYTGEICINLDMKEYKYLSKEASKKSEDLKLLIEKILSSYVNSQN